MITDSQLIENGFIFNGFVYVHSFQKRGLCICIMENQSNFINHFRPTPLSNWQLIITGLEDTDDCLTYRVKTIEEVNEIIAKFNPSLKRVNRFIAKFLIIYFLIIAISILFAVTIG